MIRGDPPQSLGSTIACSWWCHSLALVVGWSTSAICLHDDLVLLIVVVFAASMQYIQDTLAWFGDVGKPGICAWQYELASRCAALSCDISKFAARCGACWRACWHGDSKGRSREGAVGSSARQPRARALTSSSVHSGSVVSQVPPAQRV